MPWSIQLLGKIRIFLNSPALGSGCVTRKKINDGNIISLNAQRKFNSEVVFVLMLRSWLDFQEQGEEKSPWRFSFGPLLIFRKKLIMVIYAFL